MKSNKSLTTTGMSGCTAGMSDRKARISIVSAPSLQRHKFLRRRNSVSRVSAPRISAIRVSPSLVSAPWVVAVVAMVSASLLTASSALAWEDSKPQSSKAQSTAPQSTAPQSTTPHGGKTLIGGGGFGAHSGNNWASKQHSPHGRMETTLPDTIELGGDAGCLSCHEGIENVTKNMGFELSCVFCHGGNPDALTKEAAHVHPTLPAIMDNTVPPLDYDLPYQRWINPSNLRVVDQTCGQCHKAAVDDVLKSMMSTAAGHYAGGLYLNGTVDTQTPIYSTFAASDDDGFVPKDLGAVQSLLDLIVFDPEADPTDPASHFAAVPGQACARCHLWSRGKGYRGAVGQEGLYRADGCAACHMLYSDEGRSLSGDPTVDLQEQGHPMHHVVTKAIPKNQCIHCHHRGARIGLSFTGRGQMPPRLPSGPDVPGTTDVRFNGNFHYVDELTTPQDIHGERGLHCIDCHTQAGIMGDGNIWGHMDQATKIECRTCHGVPDSIANLIDNDGIPLNNVGIAGSAVFLESKVTLEVHNVPQVVKIVDPNSPAYNPRAACAMNGNHLKAEGGLECYACHAYWTPNCFGCHFERDERFMGLNLVTRQEEVGRVKTNNKVFESFRHFFMGPNREGRVSPYIVSCDPIADVTAPDGSKILDFVMPSTVNDISGLGRNPVHAHTIRSKGEVRGCAECHRSPASVGLGSGNYALARDYAMTTSLDGIRVFDRKTDPTAPTLVGTLPVTTPLAMAPWPSSIEGTADYLYVAAGADGMQVFDMCGGIPTKAFNSIEGINVIDVSRTGGFLYVVVAGEGIRIYDDNPETLDLVRSISIPNALRVVPWGVHLFVAAGTDGLIVVDISDHPTAFITGSLDGFNAVDIRPYSHFQATRQFAARVYVADPDFGVRVVDLLPDYSFPVLVGGLPLPGASGLDAYTRYLLADETTPSREHDYLYVAAGTSGLHIFDMTNPDAIFEVAVVDTLGGNAVHVDVSSDMNPPGTDDYAMVANSDLGMHVIDVTDPLNPVVVTTVDAAGAGRVYVEVQQMDRFIDERGMLLKENAHPGVGQFNRADIVRILLADITSDCSMRHDFDSDFDVDIIDFAHFDACFTGPGEMAHSACDVADTDGDGDVDMADFASLQQTFGL